MSKLKLLSDLLIHNDTSQTNDPKDASKIQLLTEESNLSACSRQKISVADAVTDQTINLADASTEYLLIYVDQEITIKLNGSGDALTLTPSTAGKKTLCFLQRGTITSLTVSNASGSAVNIDLISVKL